MNKKLKKTISVIVPCYNEEHNIRVIYKRLSQVLKKYPHQVIFIDDGSQDKTWEALMALAKAAPQVTSIKLSRNFGHQNAVYCGITQAQGQAIVIIDADLQDPPELIEEMIVKWQQGYEVVYAKRLHRRGEVFLSY